MTTFSFTAESGTNGSSVIGISSPDAWTDAPGTSVPTFTNSPTLFGSLAINNLGASGATCYARKTGFSGTDAAYRFSVRVAAYPAAITEIGQFRTATAAQLRVFLGTTGTISVNDNAGTVISGSAAIPLNTTYDIAVEGVQGGSATTGTIRYGLFNASSPTTQIEGTTVSGTANLALSPFTDFRLGKVSNSTATTNIYMDGVYATDTAGGVLPGPQNSVAPVANAGTPQTDIEPQSTVTLAGSATNSPTSYAWTQTVGTSVTLSSTTVTSPTFTAPSSVAGGTLTFSFTATNGVGTSTPDTVDITVLPQIEWVLTSTGFAPSATSIL